MTVLQLLQAQATKRVLLQWRRGQCMRTSRVQAGAREGPGLLMGGAPQQNSIHAKPPQPKPHTP